MSGAQQAILDVRGLHVWFDLGRGRELHAVRGIDIELGAGERMGLVGESGCGKTTAILAMMGLLPPSASVAGEVRIGGEDLLAGGEERMRAHRWNDVAMVFQGAMNAFNPVRTIGSQIVEPMELHDVARGRAAQARAGELLELVGIAGRRADRYPHEFSGGMRQRAAIAMALACEPRVLLADEPTTALDVMVQAQILELLVRLTEELGLALVLVTHDLPLVAQTCHRAAVMYAGRDRRARLDRRALPRAAPPVHAAALRGDAGARASRTRRSSRSPARRRGSTASSSDARSRRAATAPSTLCPSRTAPARASASGTSPPVI